MNWTNVTPSGTLKEIKNNVLEIDITDESYNIKMKNNNHSSK